MSEIENHLQSLRQELRRGVLVLAVLGQLRSLQYGYSLIQQLADHGLDVEEGTLYPLLRRLEKQGLLESKWDISETRPRKYYQISAEGQVVWTALAADWQSTVTVMKTLM
jgi:PadR family transcriptional regulator, regulatory protein PadR